jgi:quinol monooxygenase YgiN
MPFIQSVEFATQELDAMLELFTRWTADSIDNGTAQRSTLVEDRSQRGNYLLAVTFESAETAAANSDRPETGAFAQEFTALCSEAPTYREFDVVEVYGG